jgi:hypothetical protein
MRRRMSAQAGMRRWRFLASLFVVGVTGVSIAGYVALSITLNGVPKTSTLQGWAALIQPASESQKDKVELQVDSAYESSSHPYVMYTVSACGPYSYSADLLLNGNAELSNIATGDPDTPQAQKISSLDLTGLGNLSQFGWNLGPVQLFSINIPAFPCGPPSESTPFGAGSALQSNPFEGNSSPQLEGSISTPLQQSWSGPWGLWHGPHDSQSWPAVGGLGPVFTSGTGTFAINGIPGSWTLPSTEYVEITDEAFDFPSTWTINSSTPNTSAPNAAEWSSTSQIAPTAQLTDSTSAALIQDWIVICAVGLGIGGGMLATLLLEWIRPSAESSIDDKVPTPENSDFPAYALGRIERKPRGSSIAYWLAMVGMAFVIGYARGQFRGRKSLSLIYTCHLIFTRIYGTRPQDQL